MGNNRKDMSDQPGEGKKYSQRNEGEILEGRQREREREQCSSGCKTVCLRVPFNQQRKHRRIG